MSDASVRRRLTMVGGLVIIAAIGHLLAYYIVKIPTQFELLGLILIALFYPVLRRPMLGMYAIFILAPFIPYIRRLYYLAYTRPDVDPLIALADGLLIIIMLGLFFEFRDGGAKHRAARGYVLLIGAYFCMMLLRVYFFNQRSLSESLGSFKFYGLPVLYFFIGAVYSHLWGHLKNLWILSCSIGIVAALYGIKQLSLGYSTAEHLWFTSIQFSSLFIEGIARPFSIFSAPAAFADYCQLSFLGLVMIVAWSKKPLAKALYLFLPLLLYAMLITSVRSSWIGVILSLLLWALIFKVRGNTKRIAALTALVIALGSAMIISEVIGMKLSIEGLMSLFSNPEAGQQNYFNLLITNRTSAITNPLGEYSLLSRIALWQYLIYLTQDPTVALMGRGLGALKADSLYFTYLAEFGYPGMLFIIMIIVLFVKRGMHIIDTFAHPDIVILARGIVVMNVIFAIISITGTHIHSFPGDMYFWFWNGVLVRLSFVSPTATLDAQTNEIIDNA